MAKRKVWTETDIQLIKAVYSSGILQGDGKLDKLADELGILKSNLCRKARSLGLTIPSRKATEESSKQTGLRIREWLSKNEHPRGFLGGKHSEKSKAIMSEMSLHWHANATVDELNRAIDNMLDSRMKNGNWFATTRGSSMYSNCKSGKRKDLDNIFFRSRTESNYARYLKHTGVKFEYEPRKFVFEGIKRGTRGYIPDFYLPETDEWHEFKGWLDKKSQLKFKRMKKYHPLVFPKLTVIMERLSPASKKTLLEIGFEESQIIDFKPLDKKYSKEVPHWET